jgi:predicted O-methyltransferase YrrM
VHSLFVFARGPYTRNVEIQTARLQKVIESVIGGTVRAKADGTIRDIFPIAIHPREGEALSEWVARERAASSIEIGFGYGISTLFILRGLLSNRSSAPFRHLTIDPNQVDGFSSIGLQLVEDAGLSDHLDFHNDRSEFVLPRLLAEERQFDFAFVDGNHRFDWVFVDLMFLGRLVRGGSVIFLDDYQLPAVKKTVAFCTGNLGWVVEEEGAADAKQSPDAFPEHHHWVVLRTNAEPRERTFDYFIDF